MIRQVVVGIVLLLWRNLRHLPLLGVCVLGQCQVRSGVGRSRLEWSGITLEWIGFDNKMRNNLGLSLCAVPQSTVVCAVAYFRRTELLSGTSERSGMN